MKVFVATMYFKKNGDMIESAVTFDSSNENYVKEQVGAFFTEWLRHSRGTGYFIVGDPTELENVLKED